jgi:hypothetical protein
METNLSPIETIRALEAELLACQREALAHILTLSTLHALQVGYGVGFVAAKFQRTAAL